MVVDSSTTTAVQQHMAVLFRPFAKHVAEQVDQLQKSVDMLKGDFRETNQIARVALEKHFPQTTVNQDLRNEHAETKLQVSDLQKQLLEATAHIDMFEHDHDKLVETKLQVSVMQKQLFDTVAHVDMLIHSHDEHAETKHKVLDLQKRLFDTVAHVDVLKHGHDELQKQLLDTTAHVDMLKHSHDEHADTKLQVSDLQKRAHVDMLKHGHDEHAETKHKVSDLQKRLFDIVAHVDVLKHGHDELQKQLLDTTAHVDMLKHSHDEHADTKLQVSDLQKRLCDTVAHVDMLKHGHDEQAETKLQVSDLQKRLFDTVAHVDVLKHSHDTNTTLAELRNDLRNLDAAQQTTAHMLSGTRHLANDLQEEIKTFQLSSLQRLDDLQKEFKTSQQRLDDIQNKQTDKFSRVDTRLIDMSKMLAESANRVNQLKSKIAERPAAENLLEAEMSKIRAGLHDQLGQLSGALTSMQEELKKHSELLPAQEKRVLRLEISRADLQYEVRVLHEQVGTQPAIETPQPQTPENASLPQVTKPKSRRSGDGGAFVGAVNAAVMSVGLKARVEKCSKQVEAHEEIIAIANQNLQEAQNDLQRKSQRIDYLERELELLNASFSETKEALVLMQEWWKGLSHGFRETSRLVNAGQDPFPMRPGSDPFPTRPSSVNADLPTRPNSDNLFGTGLRSTTPLSPACGSRPMSARPMSAMTTKERLPWEARPTSARTAVEHHPREAKEKRRHLASRGGR